MHTRRELWPLAALVFSACAVKPTTTPVVVAPGQTVVSTFSKYAIEVENGLSALVLAPNVQALLTSDVLAKIEATLADVRGVLRLIFVATPTVSTAQAQSWVTQVESGASEIADILTATPGIPPTVIVVIDALEVVVPLMIAATGILLTKALPSTLTPAQAEQILIKPIV